MSDRLVPSINEYKKTRDKERQEMASAFGLTRFYQRAVRRVEREPSLRKYRHVLTDFWAIVAPHIPLWLANEKPRETNALLHYSWVCTGLANEIAEWAKERDSAYKHSLANSFRVLIEDVYTFAGEGVEHPRVAGVILDLANSGLLACEEGRLAEAAGYLRESITWWELQKTRHLLREGQRARAAIIKAHMIRYGTPKDKERRRKEYQRFITDLHKKHAKLGYAALACAASKHFLVSTKTIRRYTSRPV